jgi:hypothetical protein
MNSSTYNKQNNQSEYFVNLDNDLLLIITEFMTYNTCKLVSTSKQIQQRFEELAIYFFLNKQNIRKLKSTSHSQITNMLTSMDTKSLKAWGKNRTNLEREYLFRHYCVCNDVSHMKHIMSLGVDIDTELLFNTEKKFSRRAGTPPRLVKYTAIQEAIANNSLNALKLLIQYNAKLDQSECQWFLDSYISIFHYIPINLTNDDVHILVKTIGQALISQNNFSFLFNLNWINNEQLFTPFMELLYNIKKGTCTGWMSKCNLCDDEKCDINDNRRYFSHGYICCSTCINSFDWLKNVSFDKYLETMKNIHLLQQEDDDMTVDYGNYDSDSLTSIDSFADESWDHQTLFGITD